MADREYIVTVNSGVDLAALDAEMVSALGSDTIPTRKVTIANPREASRVSTHFMLSDAEAEATFIAMMNGIRPSMMEDEAIRTQAVWLIDGYTPTDAAIGVFEAAKMGTTPYPMLPYMGLLHTALGAELPDFMQGKESAEQALADVEAAYIAAAKEKGFLN